MSDELAEELEALAVAYLTQNLKEFPNGVPVDYFERTFPEKMDETPDWYKRTFNKPSVLAALQSIPKAVRLSFRGNSAFVSLNKNSDKVDQHLVDLVSNQKASTKKKRPMGIRSHSQRVLDSFTLNRRTNQNYNTENRFRSKFGRPPGAFGGFGGNRGNLSSNQENTSSWDRPSSYYNTPSRPVPTDPRVAPSDPRRVSNDGWSMPSEPKPAPKSQWSTSADPRTTHAMVPPQVRPMTTASLSQATPSKQPARIVTKSSNLRHVPAPTVPKLCVPTHQVSSPQVSTSQGPSPHVSTPISKPPYKSFGDQARSALDIELQVKKERFKENLMDMLTSKFVTIKIFYLASFYKSEYNEELNPTHYGHKSMTDLLNDPIFKNSIKVIYNHPYDMIKAVNKGELKNGEESLASRASNSYSTSNLASNGRPLVERTNNVSTYKLNNDAIGPWNVRTMLQSLEPLDIKASKLRKLPVEEVVKYRTMRIIFKRPDMTLKLDEWEREYQTEWNSRIRIHIQDYGFNTLLEFFKHMAVDIPIKIRLLKDEFVAKSDYESVAKWLSQTLAAGNYRAIMVMDKQYDQIAFPNETYPVFDLKSLSHQDYYPVVIASVNNNQKMWIQFKTKDKISSHLHIESSLTSYEDYKKKNTFKVPIQFIKVGFPCVAYDDIQQKWCRAAVTEVPDRLGEESIITVFLIDHGVSRHVKKSQLQCILKCHLNQPVGLIYAQLYGVSKGFEKKGDLILLEYTNPPVTLACKILSSMHTPEDDVDVRWQSRKSIFNVILMDTRQERGLNLAEAINNCTSTTDDVE